MDEFALLLAGSGDHVVLKATPDPDYLSHLDELGFALPQLLVPSRIRTREQHRHPGRAADDRPLLARAGQDRCARRRGLRRTACQRAGGASWPNGPGSRWPPRRRPCARRSTARSTAGASPTSWACGRPAAGPAATLDELDAAVEAGARAARRRPPGRGQGRLRRLRQGHRGGRGRTPRWTGCTAWSAPGARRPGDDRVALVVEEWVAKRADLNYQFTVGRDGQVHFDFVKEALTEGGVHMGHRIPAGSTERQTGRADGGRRGCWAGGWPPTATSASSASTPWSTRRRRSTR